MQVEQIVDRVFTLLTVLIVCGLLLMAVGTTKDIPQSQPILQNFQSTIKEPTAKINRPRYKISSTAGNTGETWTSYDLPRRLNFESYGEWMFTDAKSGQSIIIISPCIIESIEYPKDK